MSSEVNEIWEPSQTLLEWCYFSLLLYAASTGSADLFGDSPIRNVVPCGDDIWIMQCLPTKPELQKLDILPISIALEERSNKLKVGGHSKYALPSEPCDYCQFINAIKLNMSRVAAHVNAEIVIEHGTSCLDCQDRILRDILRLSMVERSLVLGCPTIVVKWSEMQLLKEYVQPEVDSPTIFGYRAEEGHGKSKRGRKRDKPDTIAAAELAIALLFAKTLIERGIAKSFKIIKPWRYADLLPDLVLVDYERSVMAAINIKSRSNVQLRLEQATPDESTKAERAFLDIQTELQRAGLVDKRLKLVQNVYILTVPEPPRSSLGSFVSEFTQDKLVQHLCTLAQSVREVLEQL